MAGIMFDYLTTAAATPMGLDPVPASSPRNKTDPWLLYPFLETQTTSFGSEISWNYSLDYYIIDWAHYILSGYENYTNIELSLSGWTSDYWLEMPNLEVEPEIEHAFLAYEPIVDITYALIVSVFAIPGVILFSLFGVISNIILLVVFYRLGVVSDSCTAILTCMGVSDLIYCLMIFAAYVVEFPYTVAAISGHFETMQTVHHFYVMRLILETPKNMLIQFNCLATAYLAVERMVSVVFPFHVKIYFNPRRSCFVMAAIFLVCTASHIHQLFNVKLVEIETENMERRTFELQLHTTGWISSEVYRVGEMINSLAIRPIAIILVMSCNLIIVLKVNFAKTRARSMRSSAGRDVTSDARASLGASSANVTNNRTSKETKLTRLMTVISVVFLLCYSPRVLKEITEMTNNPTAPFVAFVRNHLSPVIPVLELTNSCFNMLIYNALSSRFKEKLREMCSSCKCRE